MPPRTRITKDEIAVAGLELVRRGGAESLNARAVARALRCSTQPIFSNYPTMEALRADVIARAENVYRDYTAAAMRGAALPPYKAAGIAYIRFARDERQLFRLLYMRNRTGEHIGEDRAAVADLLRLIRARSGLSEDEAYRLHTQMWIWVHGVAVMCATDYLDWSMETVGDMLTEVFESLLLLFLERKSNKKELYTGLNQTAEEAR